MSSSILALDVGGRRVGVALASRAASLPNALITLEQGPQIFDKLTDIIARENVDLIVVGYPRGLEGQSTDQTRYTEEFVQELNSKIDLPTIFQDEALTSRYARDELEARGKPYSKGDIDSLAATYILQDYLAEHKENK